MTKEIDKHRLINLAKPDSNISHLKTSDVKLYTATKNLGDALQSLINEIFPRVPNFPFEWRIDLGNPLVGNDVLSYHYHVVLPQDPVSNWLFDSITLLGAFITAKMAPATTALSVDVKTLQVATPDYKSIFQNTFNLKLPIGKTMAHNVKFAIDSLFQDDLLRVDVLTADATVSGVELVIFGKYIMLTRN